MIHLQPGTMGGSGVMAAIFLWGSGRHGGGRRVRSKRVTVDKLCELRANDSSPTYRYFSVLASSQAPSGAKRLIVVTVVATSVEQTQVLDQ